LFALSPTQLHAANVNCDVPGQDLQKKIDSAEAGEELLIQGTCDNGPYAIQNKRLSLRGSGSGATLSAPDGGIVLVVRDASVFLDDLDILAGDQDGIFAVNSSAISLFGVTIQGAMGSGMHLSESSFANIESSEVDDNGIGLLLTENSSFIMGDTSVTNSGGPGVLMLGGGSETLLPGNVIDGNADGILVNLPSSIRMSGATITNNTGSGVRSLRFGFVNLESPPNTFADNAVDVECVESGGVGANEPQISDDGGPGNLVDDGSCTVIGTVF
jgi:hypothetical protein